MIGHKMIKDEILKTEQTLSERGIPEDSFWTVTFTDGSEISEQETKWILFSEEKEVRYLGKKKMVLVSKFPVKKIKCVFESMETEIEVPEGCQAYQAIRSEALFIQEQTKNRIVGRLIGVIKDNEVIEERFINGIQNKVEGFKK